ncbi:MAG: OmpA family protein [Paludibacter sp.]|nr:OmpA family protein [Paludibacter sp.]
MKRNNLFATLFLSAAIILSGCSSLNNTAKGGLLGGGGGAAIGAALGALIGKDGKSTAIGAAIGGAVGASAGAIIGKQMDKAKAEAAAIEGANTQSITDANGLPAVLVTFDSGILFATGSSTLSASAQSSLTKFAKILVENPTLALSVLGHTDNTGFANSTPAQSAQKNQELSQKRAQSVVNFLTSKGALASQFKEVAGKGQDMPIADNSTAAGKAQNRRVEIYMYASEQMVKDAESQANK